MQTLNDAVVYDDPLHNTDLEVAQHLNVRLLDVTALDRRRRSAGGGEVIGKHTDGISNWRPDEKDTRVGFFDFTLRSGLMLLGCSLQENDSSRWVEIPGDVVAFESPVAERGFRFAALTALDRYFAKRERAAAVAAEAESRLREHDTARHVAPRRSRGVEREPRD
jgi:hypothetical protein